MGLICIIKPKSTVLSSAINKSHQEKNSWECQESNPGPLGAKRDYPFALYGSPNP